MSRSRATIERELEDALSTVDRLQTELGEAKITSRPSQHGVVNAHILTTEEK